jgi:glycosyltransferase involved in cell wall biosynthesis
MEVGGAELRLVEVVEQLPPGAFVVDVCSLSGLGGSLDARVAACGGTVFPLPLNAAFPRRFLRLLRERRYHIVHSHVLHTSGPVLALAALAEIPVRIAHFQSMCDSKPPSAARTVQRWIKMHLIHRYATEIVACSVGSMDAVWRRGWRSDPRCRVIYDGVATTRFESPVDVAAVRSELGTHGDGPVFMHIGNEAEEKNHRRLLEIFAAIHQRQPSAWLVVVGDGTSRPDGVVMQRTRALGLEACTRVLGIRHDVPRLLPSADVLLLPSLREGLPGVVLEATVVGVPVLATDLPGVREIADRLPGVFYLSLSEDDAVWAGVALSLPAAAKRLQLGANPVERFRPSVFHIERAADAHRALYLSAMGQP